ncbi:MAG: hypothetical protein IT380_29770 [Myxococcales bacterium]|nr:hypothetical protein [Myxococcales bacterium]
MKTALAAALAAVVLSACGGPLSPEESPGRASQGLEAVAVSPAPTLTPMTPAGVVIIDVLDGTDIVVTPKERLEKVRTGRASFEASHITNDFQRGAGGCH